MADPIIYIVTEGEYSDYHIVGVFSSVENANECIKNEYRDSIKRQTKRVEEYEADALKLLEQREYYKFYRTLESSNENIANNIVATKHYIESLTAKLNGASPEYGDYKIEEYILDRKVTKE